MLTKPKSNHTITYAEDVMDGFVFYDKSRVQASTQLCTDIKTLQNTLEEVNVRLKSSTNHFLIEFYNSWREDIQLKLNSTTEYEAYLNQSEQEFKSAMSELDTDRKLRRIKK